MGPKLMNCYKLEQVGSKEYGKMILRIQVLEDGRVPAKEARIWKIDRTKKRITQEKEYQRLLIKFEMAVFVAQKGLWNLVGEKVLQDRGALPKEEGDVIREYKAMHEEKFLSSWLGEDGKKERIMEVDKETGEETYKKRGREKRSQERVRL